MTMAATLQEAAYLTYAQVSLSFPDANVLRPQVLAFIAATTSVVPDEIPNNRPIGNWLIPISQLGLLLTPSGPNVNVPQLYLDQVIDAVSKMCWAARRAESASQITAGQAAALLAAWNSAFGT